MPIQTEKALLTELELRKPMSGDLRGLKLTNIIEMSFDEAMELLPRISCLDERDVLNLDPENLAPIMVGITSFFFNIDVSLNESKTTTRT